jgi:hypothetical protein
LKKNEQRDGKAVCRAGVYGPHTLELVASFLNFSNLLNLYEKKASNAVRSSGVCELKNAVISAYLSHVLRQHTTHFSDGTALVCASSLPPSPTREASERRKTCNQLKGKMAHEFMDKQS